MNPVIHPVTASNSSISSADTLATHSHSHTYTEEVTQAMIDILMEDLLKTTLALKPDNLEN